MSDSNNNKWNPVTYSAK